MDHFGNRAIGFHANNINSNPLMISHLCLASVLAHSNGRAREPRQWIKGHEMKQEKMKLMLRKAETHDAGAP